MPHISATRRVSVERLPRRNFLWIGLSTAALLTGCATSMPPLKLGEGRAEWERRRQSSAATGSIIVTVSNVVAGRGSVHVGLYNETTPFPLEGAMLSSAIVPAHFSTIEARFTAIPSGTYALAVFQDLNDNGRLDTILGAVTEPTGYSGRANGSLGGAPSFKEAAFDVDRDRIGIDVKL